MRNLKKFLALVLAMMMTLSLMVTVNASSFKDDDDITAVYGEAIDVLTELGVIKGYGEAAMAALGIRDAAERIYQTVFELQK